MLQESLQLYAKMIGHSCKENSERPYLLFMSYLFYFYCVYLFYIV